VVAGPRSVLNKESGSHLNERPDQTRKSVLSIAVFEGFMQVVAVRFTDCSSEQAGTLLRAQDCQSPGETDVKGYT
jgi:hypothetical protein